MIASSWLMPFYNKNATQNRLYFSRLENSIGKIVNPLGGIFIIKFGTIL